MKMKCCVKECSNDSNTDTNKISFHKFPTAEWKREKWIEILKVDGIKPWSLICSKHFHESDFIVDGAGNKRRLFPSAMPSLLEMQPIEEVIMEELVEVADMESPNSLRAQNVERAVVNDEDEISIEQPTCTKFFDQNNLESPNSLRTQSVERAIVYDEAEISIEQPTCSKSVDQNIDHVDSVPPNEPSSEEMCSHPLQYQVLEIDTLLPLASSFDSAKTDLVKSNKKDKKISLKKALCSSDDASSDDISSDDVSSSNCSPRKKKLKLKIKTLRQSVAKYRLKVKSLNQNLRRKTKKIASLNETISNFKSGIQ